MDSEQLASLILLGFYGVIFFVIAFISYIYTSLVISKIAQKLGRTDKWKAWVPIVKGAYQLELGDFSPWYYLLIFIPILGLIPVTVLGIVAWFRITEKRGFPNWVGLIVGLAWLIPNGGMIAQYIAQGYIAWGEYEKKKS